MTARWTDLETALAAQIATEPAFLYVAAASRNGLVTPTAFPSALVTVLAGRTIETSAVAGAQYITKRIDFQVLLSTRLGDAAAIGDSRLATGGVWDLYDKLQAKLLGFTPAITNTTTATWPCVEQDFYLDRLEEGAVDLNTLWSVDVKLQNVYP